MGLMKKIMVLVIVVLVAYFFVQEFGAGFFGSGIERMKTIDSKYGVSSEVIVPGDPAELEAYERELRGLHGGLTAQEKKIVELKIALVEMQKSMLTFSEAGLLTDYSNPDCSINGTINTAKKRGQSVVEAAAKVLSIRESAQSIQGFEYIKEQEFELLIKAVNDSVQANINGMNLLC